LCLLALICVECLFNQLSVWKVKNGEKYFLELSDLAKVCKPEDLILTNGGKNPLCLYFADRKGSSLFLNEMDESNEITRHFQYADYLFWDKKDKLPEIFNFLIIVKETDHWIIMKEM